MRPTMVEVGDVLLEHRPQLTLPKDEQVVHALAPDRTQEAFTKRIGFWRSIGRFQYGNACPCCDTRELLAELAIVVTNQVLRMHIKGRRLAQLLRYPGIGGVT